MLNRRRRIDGRDERGSTFDSRDAERWQEHLADEKVRTSPIASVIQSLFADAVGRVHGGDNITGIAQVDLYSALKGSPVGALKPTEKEPRSPRQGRRSVSLKTAV